MATQNQDLKYRLLGEDVSAGRTFSKVGDAARSAHGAISELGQTLNSTGAFAPFAQGLDAISMGFQHIQDNGKSARVVMEGVGIGIAAAGAALLGLGANAQQATAGLKQAIENTGGTYSDYSKQVEETVAKTATFGRTAGDTENALARLTTATQSPQKALSLMGLTANIAAARNISLTDASQMLTTALAGNTRVFRQFGINVGTGKLSADQLNKALDELNQRLSGRAQAQADTFSGRIKALGVEFENGFESLTKYAPALLTVGSSLTVVSSAWDLVAKAKARNAAQDIVNESTTRRVITAEGEAAATGLAETRTPGAMPMFSGGRLLRAGGLAVGGLVAGQVAGAAFGGRTGGTVGDAFSAAGVGAGIGTLLEPGFGTLIGAGIGAIGGGLLGYLTGSGGGGKLAAQQKQLALAQSSNDQALASQVQGYLPGEFDELGNPKAAKIATATEALAKAKTRLTRAQEDLNKAQSKGTDPLKVEAAVAHLAAAEANLRKAEYVGGDARIASAQSAVASAHAHLNALHAGTDTTAAARRVADAHTAVQTAQHHVRAARAATQGLSLSEVFARFAGNTRTEQRLAADQSTLVDKFHIARPELVQLDALEKQVPGTLDRITRSMTRPLAEKLNRQQAAYDAAGKAFAAGVTRAFASPVEALGKQLADDQARAYTRRMNQLKIPYTGVFDLGPPSNISPRGGLAGIYIQNMTVPADDPHKLARDLAAQARHRALSGVPANASQ